jgi:hypothetical protein
MSRACGKQNTKQNIKHKTNKQTKNNNNQVLFNSISQSVRVSNNTLDVLPGWLAALPLLSTLDMDDNHLGADAYVLLLFLLD